MEVPGTVLYSPPHPKDQESRFALPFHFVKLGTLQPPVGLEVPPLLMKTITLGARATDKSKTFCDMFSFILPTHISQSRSIYGVPTQAVQSPEDNGSSRTLASESYLSSLKGKGKGPMHTGIRV